MARVSASGNELNLSYRRKRLLGWLAGNQRSDNRR
jgi:hypothetical protein